MKEPEGWGDRGEWYVVVQVILFAIIFLLPLVGPDLAPWPAPWSAIGVLLGIVLILTGGIIALAGLIRLGRNLTAVPHPKPDATFVGHGIYRLVRHPIYSGIIYGAFGWGLLMNNYLSLLMAVVLFLFFDIKTRREERWLSAKFPEYAAYQSRVRKLIPFIY